MPRDVRELRGAWRRYQRHAYPPVSPDLARYVEHYWLVRWHYPEPYRQKVAPSPSVHLTFRDGRARLTGVCRRHQIRVLEGDGAVFGVAFRPGCFRPFLDAPVSTITDRSLDAAAVFGPDLPGHLDVAAVERFLRAHLPQPDPRTAEAAGAVATIAAVPQITRVGALARECGASIRQVQRLFADYVGVGPKWVIRRYRLHEVTERLSRGTDIDWASLAAELGYADQAHFIRDFSRMYGEPPTSYAQRY